MKIKEVPIKYIESIEKHTDMLHIENLMKSIPLIGLVQPITIKKNRLIDGWHRYWACRLLGHKTIRAFIYK